MNAESFDVVVIGAGSTGTNVAGYARDNGLSVAIVESDLVGGECSYWACMPSKALLGPVHAVAAADRLAGADAAVSRSIDVDAVLARRDDIISELDDASQVEWVESIGAVLIRGRGSLAGERRVDVRSGDDSIRQLAARRGVVIATGSRPLVPPIDGIDAVDVWTNREATTTGEIPGRLLIVGGGVVGCELAQAFSRLGATVTIVESEERILTNFSVAVAGVLADALDADGITVRTGVEARAVQRHGATVTVTLSDGSLIEADRLMVATGRRFNTDDIGLDTVGLTPGGPIEVDDRLRVRGVAGGWLFAAGDVNGRALLTHQGKYQARCVGDTVAGHDTAAWADGTAVPQVVFTDPQIAAVGRSETDADGDDSLRVVTVEMSSVAAASLAAQTAGRASLVIDEVRDVVVGASFVGHDVGEVLHSATIAIVGEVPVKRLWHAVPSFPTMSEVWLRLLEEIRGL
ncbi:MAG: NAD(P)/FAD-dependent oxidoreductase [Acidimicrobiales bacterium]